MAKTHFSFAIGYEVEIASWSFFISLIIFLKQNYLKVDKIHLGLFWCFCLFTAIYKKPLSKSITKIFCFLMRFLKFWPLTLEIYVCIYISQTGSHVNQIDLELVMKLRLNVCVLAIQVCTIMSSLCGAGNWSQEFVFHW